MYLKINPMETVLQRCYVFKILQLRISTHTNEMYIWTVVYNEIVPNNDNLSLKSYFYVTW